MPRIRELLGGVCNLWRACWVGCRVAVRFECFRVHCVRTIVDHARRGVPARGSRAVGRATESLNQQSNSLAQLRIVLDIKFCRRISSLDTTDIGLQPAGPGQG
jgi:hypothetical protein